MTTGRRWLADDLAGAWLAAAAARGAAVPAYDLAGVRPSVVHIGPGVFHRAHQAVYGDDVLARARWGRNCAVTCARRTAPRAGPHGHLYTLLGAATATTGGD